MRKNSKKRLIIVVPQLNIGGGEKQLLALVKKFNTEIFDIILINLDSTAGALVNQFNNETIKLIELLPCGKADLLKQLYNIYKKEEPDIIHTWLNNDWGRIAGIGYKLTINSKVRIIASERHDMFLYERRFKSFFICLHYLLSYFSNTVTFNSEVPIKKIVNVLYSKNKIKFIPNGISLKVNEKISKESVIMPKKTLNLVIVARLVPVKNHVFLFKALSKIKSLIDFHLHIVGDGVLRKPLEDEIRNLEIESKVTFYGELKDPVNVISSSDIGLLVSTSEGFSNTLLEYLLYGKAIIATNVGSNSHCVCNNGFIVNSEEELISAILEYGNNDNLVSFHGNNSLKLIKNFCIEKVAEQYQDIYLKL